MPDQGAILKKRTLFQRVRHSIFPGQLQPVKDREGYRRFFNTLILHFRPRTVPERTLELTLTWGLGGMAVVLVLMLMGTGVLLKFVYEPLPEKAYESNFLQVRSTRLASSTGLLVWDYFVQFYFPILPAISCPGINSPSGQLPSAPACWSISQGSAGGFKI